MDNVKWTREGGDKWRAVVKTVMNRRVLGTSEQVQLSASQTQLVLWNYLFLSNGILKFELCCLQAEVSFLPPEFS